MDTFTQQKQLLIAAVIYFIICFLLAWTIGRKRKVGLGWSLLFSMLLTPFIGLVIMLSSGKLKGGEGL